MATAFPTDAESGNPRNYTRLTSLFAKARYRTNVGDSNAAGKLLMLIQAVSGQTADLIGAFDSSKNPLFSFDASGGLVQGSGNVSQRIVQVTLSAAQITTLHSAPVALIAAPGASKALIVTGFVFQFKYGTVQFTGGGVVNPVYHSATTSLTAGGVAAATIQAAANYTGYSPGAAGATALAISSNTGVDLYAATADFAAGDSTAIVTVSYDVITLG